MTTRNHTTTAMMAPQVLPDASGDADVPEWIHILPAGEIVTVDRRGPYRVRDAQAMIAASFAENTRIPIDINHALQLAAPRGEPSPLQGNVVAMQAREDGIWGQVEWNAAGRALIAGGAYRGISPVVVHSPTKDILGVSVVSLVNRPNLRGLTALNMETDMMFQARLAKMLGLDEGADDDAIVAAIKKMGGEEKTEAMQSALGEIGTALGLSDGANTAAILTAAKASGANTGDGQVIEALQAELNTMAETVNELQDERARDTATAFVDTAIRDKRVGVSNQRDRFIAMHMRDPAEAEAIIGGLAQLGATGMTIAPPTKTADGEIALQSSQSEAARLLGIDPAAYAKTLAAEQKAEGML